MNAMTVMKKNTTMKSMKAMTVMTQNAALKGLLKAVEEHCLRETISADSAQ